MKPARENTHKHTATAIGFGLLS